MNTSYLPRTFWTKILGLFLLAELFALPLQANPGDTTVVTVWNLKKLTQYGNYDTVATFPVNKRYRKIRLHYILGRYACPGNPQYCGSWDYTTQIFARPANKDSVEIMRVITPYATDWLSLNKTHDYIEDVTDYASALEGITAMRFNYSGYSWGFTITLKIEFIEGVPPMDALEVRNVYDGYFPFGNSANSIENYLTPKTFTYGTTAAKVFLKNTISGHGSDNTGCSEFCNKYYRLYIDNTQLAQHQIWRNTCGENDVYPQTGTWVYNRGNWCPGAIVWPIYHDLTASTSANTSFSVNIDMQTYVGGGSLGGYNYESQIITYGAPNNSRDVAIEDIMAPTKDDNYFRHNPRCANPLIKIRNTGSDSVKTIEFAYNVNGGVPLTYTWTGQLGFLDTTTVVFPPSSSIMGGSAISVFQASVTSVNGAGSDQNNFNDTYRSLFDPVYVMPDSFVVKMLSNNAAADNFWTLSDENNMVIVSSQPMSNASLYKDTILNLPPGCYRFDVYDYGCDGLAWWANTSQGTGSLRFERLNGQYLYGFPTDFGCSFTKHFVVKAPPTPTVDTTPVNEIQNTINAIEVFPSPSSGVAYIKLDLGKTQNVSYFLTDVNGRVVLNKQLRNVESMYEQVDVSQLQDGLYFMTIQLQDKTQVSKKLIIAK